MPTKIDHTTVVRVHPIKHPKANSCSDFQCYKLLVVQSKLNDHIKVDYLWYILAMGPSVP